MGRLAKKDAEGVRAIQAYLATYDNEAPESVASTVAANLKELLQTDAAFAYGLAPVADGLTLSHLSGHGLDARVATQLLSSMIESQRIGWGAYNPIKPEPAQRNLVVTGSDLGEAYTQTPIFREILPRIGVANADQLRVLICDGPAFLLCIGGFQRASYEPWQKRLLQLLVPSLKKRMVMQHALANAPVVTSALAEALEALARPAFLITDTGAVKVANTAGTHLWESDRRRTCDSLIDCARRPERAQRFSVTRVKSNDRRDHFLVIGKPDRSLETQTRTLAAAQRWQLSKRQREVLLLIVEGGTNRVIAATLGIAERTVEVHITAILDKAQVENRSELAASVWRG